MAKPNGSSASFSKPQQTSKKSWFKSNVLWPGLFLVGFALVVTLLSLIVSVPRDDAKSKVESTYGVTVERMPASFLNETITVSHSDYSHMIRCALPSDRDMENRISMKCKDSSGELTIPAR